MYLLLAIVRDSIRNIIRLSQCRKTYILYVSSVSWKLFIWNNHIATERHYLRSNWELRHYCSLQWLDSYVLGYARAIWNLRAIRNKKKSKKIVRNKNNKWNWWNVARALEPMFLRKLWWKMITLNSIFSINRSCSRNYFFEFRMKNIYSMGIRIMCAIWMWTTRCCDCLIVIHYQEKQFLTRICRKYVCVDFVTWTAHITTHNSYFLFHIHCILCIRYKHVHICSYVQMFTLCVLCE